MCVCVCVCVCVRAPKEYIPITNLRLFSIFNNLNLG